MLHSETERGAKPQERGANPQDQYQFCELKSIVASLQGSVNTLTERMRVIEERIPPPPTPPTPSEEHSKKEE